MENQTDILEQAGESFEYANQYFHKQIALIKLEGAERIAKTTSTLLTTAVLFLIASLVIIMFSIALGFWLGTVLNSYGLSFLIIAVIFSLIGIGIYVFKQQLITNPVLTQILKSIFE